MPSSDTGLLNAAHQHAANADESFAQGLLPPARSSHQQASALFATCAEQATSDTTKRTLRQLSEKHARAAHDLEARIAKLRTDGVDLSVPYKPKTSPRPSPSSRSPSSATIVPMRPASPPTSPSKDRGDTRQRMSDSQAPGESFMVLGARSQGDPGDAFNKFWRAMEGLENRLSQPVAFTSVPLESQALNSSSSSSDSDADRHMKSTVRSRKPVGASASSSKYPAGPSVQQTGISSFPPPQISAPPLDLQAELDEVLADDFDDLSESFFLIPSSSNGKPSTSSSSHLARSIQPPSSSLSHLQSENKDLKSQLARAQAQLASQAQALRSRADQDAELRASISLAKAEAQRVVMAASMYMPGPPPAGPSISPTPPLPLPVPTDLPIPGLGPKLPSTPGKTSADREKERMEEKEKQDARIKELEAALAASKTEIEKQRALIARFREKWEKLKENSKRKKSARAEAEASAARVSGGIAEEPEEEARALALDLAGDGLV